MKRALCVDEAGQEVAMKILDITPLRNYPSAARRTQASGPAMGTRLDGAR